MNYTAIDSNTAFMECQYILQVISINFGEEFRGFLLKGNAKR